MKKCCHQLSLTPFQEKLKLMAMEVCGGTKENPFSKISFLVSIHEIQIFLKKNVTCIHDYRRSLDS
jgi:hypothetical protein